MAENIGPDEFAARMGAFARHAPSSAIASNASALAGHLNSFEPTRKALAYLLGEERAKRPTTTVLDNGVPCLTALHILERITFVVT